MSFKIKAIRPIENEPLSLVVLEYLENGEKKTEKLVVFCDFCPENGIGVGAIDENTVEELRDTAKLTYAVRRGEALLGYAANSERNLVSKLVRRGISPDHARRAARILTERGFIDDRENALAEAEKCVKKLWGPRRILQELAAKGYRGEVLDEARAYLEDVDFFASLSALIEKKYRGVLSDEEKERERAVAALVRYGYTVSQVRACIAKKRGEKWQI